MKKFRLKHGLSQRKLAKMMNIPRSTISNWELGIRKPNMKSKFKIFCFYVKFYLFLIRY